ncbi:MAG TPA: N-acetylmuramic acid 6-phosphate etherase [Ktedonobacterales bacterium]
MPHDAMSSPDTGATTTESVNPATAAIDRMSPLEIAQAMNAEDARVATAVRGELPRIAAAIEAIAARLRAGGRLIYAGAGTSGRLAALDAIECPPTFNIAPARIVACVAGGEFALGAAAEAAEDDAAAGQADIAATGAGVGDAVVAISASGRTPYALGAAAAARDAGALVIGLVCNADTPLAGLADIAIAPVVGPEVIAGSTRLKAGTAQKMVLNMLSTGAMVLLGKTYGALMVDVQATNAKLRARARAAVQAATGLDAEAAAEQLRAADGDAKVAILASRLDIQPATARARLAAHGGVLRAALEER